MALRATIVHFPTASCLDALTQKMLRFHFDWGFICMRIFMKYQFRLGNLSGTITEHAWIGRLPVTWRVG